MITGLYKSAWGALAAQIRQEAVANNMANVNTTGFRPDYVTMRSYKTRSEAQGLAARPDRRMLWAVGSGSMVAETRTAHKSGPLRHTGVSTDLAIRGSRGFFVVEKDGELRYTRAGNFQVNSRGQLVTADGGWLVRDAGGSPLQVGGPDFLVDADGLVRRLTPAGEQEIGRIDVREFEDPGALVKTAGTLFTAPEGVEPLSAPAEAKVQQNFLEMSATNAPRTMINMIEAMRSYEANLNFVRMQDQLLGRAVTEIARLGG